MRWIQTTPIAVHVDTDQRLASHEQVELVCLGIGLAFRGIWIAQFPGNYRDVPDYIINSPYEFAEYERLSNMIDTLISGFRSLYIMSFPHRREASPTIQPGPTASTSGNTASIVIGQRDLIVGEMASSLQHGLGLPGYVETKYTIYTSNV
jgi:hypothetical protein